MIMDKTISEYDLRVGFHECAEQDFFIRTFGYNDLHYITPIKIPHVQSMNTLHIVLSGSGTVCLKDKKYKLKKHDMFFIPPGTSHCYYPDPGDEWTYIWFDFVGKNSDVYTSLMGLCSDEPVGKCKDFKNFYYYIYGLLQKLEQRGTLGYYEILSAFYRLLDSNTATAAESVKNHADTAMSYISCHYQDPNLSISDICKDLNMSHSYLCKLFKAHTGTSVVRYLVSFRIERAAELLKTTTLSVKEIAYSVGFNDYLHFMKTFKAQTGLSAGEYRKGFIKDK